MGSALKFLFQKLLLMNEQKPEHFTEMNRSSTKIFLLFLKNQSFHCIDQIQNGRLLLEKSGSPMAGIHSNMVRIQIFHRHFFINSSQFRNKSLVQQLWHSITKTLNIPPERDFVKTVISSTHQNTARIVITESSCKAVKILLIVALSTIRSTFFSVSIAKNVLIANIL